MNDLGIPVLQPGEDWYIFYNRLERGLIEDHVNKRDKILKFINDWYSKKPNSYKFENIWQFKNQYYTLMPDDNLSKEFLIKHFNEYNEFFKLDLEYNEELFTTYNVLYFIKLMLKTLNGDLKKEIEERQGRNGIVKKYKKYSVKLKYK